MEELMKNRRLYCILLLPVFQFHSSSSVGDHQFIKQRCDKFKYEITVPAHWETDEITLEKKHIFVSFSADAEIRVRAFAAEDTNIETTVWKRRWNLRAIDPLLDNIIETEKIHIRKNIRDKLLVFEYRSNKKKVLQRTLISQSGNIIYIVDCKSSLRSFYKHEKYFNIALSSFEIAPNDALDESFHTTPPASQPAENKEKKSVIDAKENDEDSL